MADLSDKCDKYEYDKGEFVPIDSKKIFIQAKCNCG